MCAVFIMHVTRKAYITSYVTVDERAAAGPGSRSRPTRGGANLGGSVPSVNVTNFSIRADAHASRLGRPSCLRR